jgi:mRNA interferase RelE/StbE
VYEIFVLPTAQKDLDKLGVSVLARVLKKIRVLSENPRPPGALKLTDEDGFRFRMGDYRLLYRIGDPLKRIYIYRIKHRKDVYS